MSKNLQQYNAVPPTPLLTSDVLKEENEQWPDVQQGMSLALREMRVDQVRAYCLLREVGKFEEVTEKVERITSFLKAT